MAGDNYIAQFDRWTASGEASDPARRVFAVTPSDTLDITNGAGVNAPQYADGLYIGVTGNVTIIAAGDASGTPVTFANHPVGYLPVQVRRVMATGTTAGSIVALVP